MITVRAISGSATARVLKIVKDFTGQPLMLIKQQVEAGDVFLSCPYPDQDGDLTEFAGVVSALCAEGVALDLREVWHDGDSRPITLEHLANLITLEQEIERADREHIDRLADS